MKPNHIQSFFLLTFIMGTSHWSALRAQSTQIQTYCNPINLDYAYMISNTDKNLSYRSGADPAVVRFRNEYDMFVTRSMGYWHSTDLQNRGFVAPKK